SFTCFTAENDMKTRSMIFVAVLFLLIRSASSQDLSAVRTPSPSRSPDPDAVAWLAAHEKQLAVTTDRSGRLALLRNMAPAALAANQPQKAEAFAKELMDLGSELKTSPGFGPGLYSDATF